jgi:hypothetical protein
MNRSAAVLIALGITNASRVEAQSDLCRNTRALPACRSWLVTEVGAEFPLGSTGGRYPGASGDIDSHVVATAGVMKNWRTAAVGLTGSAMTTGAKDGARGEVRYRRWSNAKLALQASGGIVHWSVPGLTSNRAEPATGVTGSVGIDRGWLGADARVDLLQAEGRQVSAFSVGAHLGETPARVVAASAVAMAVLLFLRLGG